MNQETTPPITEHVEKLKELVEDINICLFCTQLKTADGATCRPMSAQKVDDEGNLWFFSEVNSNKNKEISQDKHVQLFFAHPGKSRYLVVNGEAEVIINQHQIDALWSPMVKIWFSEGKDDPSLSLIKVNTKSAFYWDTENSKMINFIKMMATLVTGTPNSIGNHGEIVL
jgi:general stress protein 26